jgi:tetratricopeptide (TPR) repeat protein
MSLFTLGELYYRNRKWAEAILRLEEAIERYPQDGGVPRALFMLAETYRRSGMEIGESMKKDGVALEQRESLTKARLERLERAMGLFGKVISLLDAEFERSQEPDGKGPGDSDLTELEQEFLKTAYMNRAGCAYEMADYSTAIRFYDMTATRFSQDVTAVEAFLQIVNAYQAMGQAAQASAAAERARWVLKRIPDEAFGRGTVKLTRDYYENLLVISKGS